MDKDPAAGSEGGKTAGVVGAGEQISVRQRRFRLFKTTVFVLTWVAQGMRTSMGTAVLPDLRTRLNATTAQMSYAFSMGFVGATVGAPLATVSDRFGDQADMVICGVLSVGSVLIALKPLTTQLWAYAAFDFFENVLFGILPPMGNSVLLAIWGAGGSTGAIQALHMGWPIGQVLGPLIAIPFVSDTPPEGANDTAAYGISDISDDPGIDSSWIQMYTYLAKGYRTWKTIFLGEAEQPVMTSHNGHVNVTSYIEPETHNLDDRFRDDSRIQVAYWIVSCYMLLMATLFAVMECFKTRDIRAAVNKRSSAWRDIVRPAHWSAGDGRFGVIMFALLAAFFVMHIGCQTGVAIYITVFAVDSGLGFTNQQGALLNSMLNFSGMLARFIAILIAKWVSNLSMMWVLVHGELVAALMYVVWGTRTKVGLWVSTICFGLLHRPIWGAAYVWVNDYIALLAVVIACLNFTTNLCGVFQVSLYGYLYEETVIESVFYMCSLYAGLVCFVWYAMYYTGKVNGTRHDRTAITELVNETEITQQSLPDSKQEKEEIGLEGGKSNASYVNDKEVGDNPYHITGTGNSDCDSTFDLRQSHDASGNEPTETKPNDTVYHSFYNTSL